MTADRSTRPETLPIDPIAEAIADVDGCPRPSRARRRRAEPTTKELLIIDYSGDLEKIWADADPGLDRPPRGRPDAASS